MLTSFYGEISALMDIIVGLKPKSILDIGAGFGKYGFLCREYLDIADGRIPKSKWETWIEGIEINPEAANPVHDFAYDRFHCGDALKIVPMLNRRYDLSLMIDLLGYLAKEQGLELLQNALSISGMLLAVISGDSLIATGHKLMPNDFAEFDIVRSGYLSMGKENSMVLLIKGNGGDS